MTWRTLLKGWKPTTKTAITLIELAMIALCSFIPGKTDAHILVYRRTTQQLIEEYNDLPAQFGPGLPANGLKVFSWPAYPPQACEKVEPPDATQYPKNAKFVAIIERGGDQCSFELKVRNAQTARFDAVIVYNNNGDDLETMSAANASGIRIPSVFVGHTTGISLKSFYTDEIVILINDELPFNINTQLILPFSILIGLCFLIMIFYMIYKCIREERRLRRYRLPKSMLKKLPILKYTKNSEIANETCVICIEDFIEGDKVRILPCKHSYHTHCIDPWLTENRRVCPICKRKVFTKGGARCHRNRQTSLDSVTDTDDDTTPLLQPSATSTNNNQSNNANSRRNARSVRNPTASATSRRATSTTTSANTTRHGTFRRDRGEVDTAAVAATSSVSVDEATSDDENVLLTQQSPFHNARRVNPFDRSPNLPPHLAEQLNSENRRSIWSGLHIFRLFRRRQPISITAPPYLEEGVSGTEEISVQQPQRSNATINLPTPLPTSSNNISNPYLSGSFKDDNDVDEMIPHQSIYDPIGTVTPTARTQTIDEGLRPVAQDSDAVFIQTDIANLPNTTFSASSGSSRQANNSRFNI